MNPKTHPENGPMLLAWATPSIETSDFQRETFTERLRRSLRKAWETSLNQIVETVTKAWLEERRLRRRLSIEENQKVFEELRKKFEQGDRRVVPVPEFFSSEELTDGARLAAICLLNHHLRDLILTELESRRNSAFYNNEGQVLMNCGMITVGSPKFVW